MVRHINRKKAQEKQENRGIKLNNGGNAVEGDGGKEEERLSGG